MTHKEKRLPPTLVEGPAAVLTVRWYERIWGRLEEPAAMTAAQIVTFLLSGLAGVVAVVGGFPHLLQSAIGFGAVLVGALMVTGCVVGAVACWNGIWWLERIALQLCGLGFVLFIPSLLYVELRLPLRLFLLLLVALAVVDLFKRYRRIDWAYLDPTK